MRRTLAMLALPWILLGCNASSDHVTSSQKTAIRCAENWRKQGFNFDPNTMTCSEMFGKAQSIRRAAYWAEEGYCFDPNVITSEEMDQKVRDIKQAKYWKQKHGYTFDANSLTAEEMDRKAKELETAAFWEQQGYYYDLNSRKVYLSREMGTELGTLTSLHVTDDRGTNFAPTPSDERFSRSIPQSASSTYSSPLRPPSRINPRLASPPTAQPSPLVPLGVLNANRYDPDSLANPYGAGSPYKTDGLMNPYSEYGSKYSSKSWTNPYATNTPKLYDSQGNYRGKLSTNRYDPDSVSNPYGRYGNPYSPDSINNPYGAGNPYSSTPIYVVPSK